MGIYGGQKFGNVKKIKKGKEEKEDTGYYLLLSKEFETSFTVSDDIKNKIATENLQPFINKQGEQCYKTKRDIQKGEQIGFDYGPLYPRQILMNKHIMLLDFDKDGNVLLPKQDATH